MVEKEISVWLALGSDKTLEGELASDIEKNLNILMNGILLFRFSKSHTIPLKIKDGII